jgi:hypothetical protein
MYGSNRIFWCPQCVHRVCKHPWQGIGVDDNNDNDERFIRDLSSDRERPGSKSDPLPPDVCIRYTDISALGSPSPIALGWRGIVPGCAACP